MIEGRIPSQNLAVLQGKDVSAKPPRFYKSLMFDAIAALLALSAGYAYSNYLANPGLSPTFFLVTLATYLVFATMQLFLTDSLSRQLVMIGLQTIFFLIFFIPDIQAYYFAPALAFALWFLWGCLLARRALRNTVRIAFLRDSHLFLKKFVTGITIALVVLYIPHWTVDHIFVSEDTFSPFYVNAANFAHSFYPNFDLNASFSMVAESLAKQELAQNTAFTSMPLDTQATVISQATAQIIKEVSTQLGTTVTPEEPTEHVVYGYILTMLKQWKDQFGVWFLLGWFVVLYFILRGFAWLFSLIVGFVAFILYQIFVAADIVQISNESVLKEIISM